MVNNMEKRTIVLTLKKAREWYKQGAELREVALQAYCEEELKEHSFRDIKTFEDACYVIMLCPYTEGKLIKQIEEVSKASAAAYKLNIIRRALNKGQKMKLTEGTIYYPQIRFTTKASKYYKDELNSGYMVKVGTIEQSCRDLYDVLGGGAYHGGYAGLGGFNSLTGVGDAYARVGFLGCASREIAEHMSKYFAREIFDAMYRDFVDYKWV